MPKPFNISKYKFACSGNRSKVRNTKTAMPTKHIGKTKPSIAFMKLLLPDVRLMRLPKKLGNMLRAKLVENWVKNGPRTGKTGDDLLDNLWRLDSPAPFLRIRDIALVNRVGQSNSLVLSEFALKRLHRLGHPLNKPRHPSASAAPKNTLSLVRQRTAESAQRRSESFSSARKGHAVHQSHLLPLDSSITPMVP